MLLIQISFILLAILLIVNIFLTLKARKKEESTDLTETKNAIGSAHIEPLQP